MSDEATPVHSWQVGCFQATLFVRGVDRSTFVEWAPVAPEMLSRAELAAFHAGRLDALLALQARWPGWAVPIGTDHDPLIVRVEAWYTRRPV